jgi:hypothetical protein
MYISVSIGRGSVAGGRQLLCGCQHPRRRGIWAKLAQNGKKKNLKIQCPSIFACKARWCADFRDCFFFSVKALKENRQKAYEDFFAVAEHLIAKGVAFKKYSLQCLYLVNILGH